MLTLLRRRSSGSFRTRAHERDQISDLKTVGAIATAIDQAIKTLSLEKAGLARRIEDAVSRGSVTAGNAYDEYLTRDDRKTDALAYFEAEMISGRKRLKLLDEKIADLNFLRVAYRTRFGNSTD